MLTEPTAASPTQIAVPGPERPHPAAVLQAVTSRSQVPDEVRIPLTPLLTPDTSEEFLQAILEWRVTSIYCINLKPKDLVLLFERYDKVFVERIQELESSPPGSEDVELRVEILLRAGIQLLEYLKSVKYVILFKSADLILEVYRNSTSFTNLMLATELLTYFLKAFRKKEFIHEYLKTAIFPLITCIYIFAHQFNILSTELNYELEDLLPNPENKRKLNELLNKPEITVDLAREYNLDFSYLEEFENSSVRSERVVSILDIVKQPVSQMNAAIENLIDTKLKMSMDGNSPLKLALRFKIMFYKELQHSGNAIRVATLSLRAVTLHNTVTEDPAYSNYLRACRGMLSPVRVDLGWENVERMLHNSYPTEFYIVLLEAKWSTIQSSPFNSDQVNLMHQLLQRLMTGIQRQLQKEKSEINIESQRKSSMEQLESIVQGDESNVKPLFASTEERYVSSIVELIKEVFLFEDRSVDSGIQSDYSQVFDMVSGYLYFITDPNKDYFKFSPRLVSLIFELLKVDMGASSSIVKKLLDLLSSLIKKPLTKYRHEDGCIRELAEERLVEYMLELIELVDSLFVEPTKNYYITQISQFAREAAEHPIWDELSDLPAVMRPIYNPIVVFLDDILTEMPENLVNPTLKHITENGLSAKLVENYMTAEKFDYEYIGFFIQFVGKNINCPYKPENFEEILENCLRKAFRAVSKRMHVAHNIKRFSGADSTNSLVVLAEEMIDLVNVKNSITPVIVKLMDDFLKHMISFYSEMWIVMPKIVRGQSLTAEEAPILVGDGWSFSEELRDNFLMLEKLSQNFIKFFAKFYDIHRTNLHLEFPKIEGLTKFIRILVLQPLFDTAVTKQRRFLSSSFSRMTNQPGNESQRETALSQCFLMMNELCRTFREQRAKLTEEDMNRLGFFLFKQNDVVTSNLVFKNDTNDDRVRASLLTVNTYHSLTMVAELLKNSMNLNKDHFENDEDEKLKALYPQFIELERSMIPVKVNWFSKRVREWPLSIGAGKTEITFDNFSDFTFGAMEMFTNETIPKAFEKIMKGVNGANIQKKIPLLSDYVTACCKIMQEEHVSDDLTFENAFRYSKIIQTFAYMLSNFEGITILITLKEQGALDFCQRAILFGLNFIKHHRDDLLKIKSVKEAKKPDPRLKSIVNKQDLCVKVDQNLNNLKYVLETLCPKLMVCWRMLGDYFSLQRPENTPKEDENNQRERFHAARFAALCAVRSIIKSTPTEVSDISDRMTYIDIADPVQTQDNNAMTENKPPTENVEPKVVLKNVSNGYDTLRHIHSFIQASIDGAIEMLHKYMNIVTKVEKPQVDRALSSEKKEDTVQIRDESEVKEQADQPQATPKKLTKNEQVMNEEEIKSIPDQVIDESRPERLTNEQFVLRSKTMLNKLLEEILATKLTMYGHLPNNFSNEFMNLMAKVDPNHKKNLSKLITMLTGKVAEIRSNFFYRPEPKKDEITPPKPRISKIFLKDFRTGNMTCFKQLNVLLNLMCDVVDEDQQSNSISKEQALIFGFLIDLLENFSKLTEIKKLQMNPENFRRRYAQVLNLLDKLTAICVRMTMSSLKQAKEDTKDEPQSSMKRNSSKKVSRIKEKVAIEDAKRDVVHAIAEYLSNYPQFIKAKVNIISNNCIYEFCNLLYYLSKEKPELREMIRNQELVKKFCRAGAASEDTDGALDELGVRGFLALVDDQTRTDKLIEESVKLEVKHYFKVHKQVRDEIIGKDGMDNSIPPEDIELKYVKLNKFEEDFKKIAASYMNVLVTVTKERCEIHSKGDEQFIALKENIKDKEYTPENESTSVILCLMKEVIRSSAGILVDRVALGQEKTPVKQMMSLSYLIEVLCKVLVRYPVLLRYVLGYNLSKIIKKLKNQYIRDRFEVELRENQNINFLQFFIRVTMFIDFKNFKYFMAELCKDSYVYQIEKHVKGTQQLTINSSIRRIYYKEVNSELMKIRDDTKFLSMESNFMDDNHEGLGIPRRYYFLRLFSTYCAAAQELAGMLHNLKYINLHGEINLYLFQKTLNECVNVFTVESIQIHKEIYDVLTKSLFFLMKVNFLCHANKNRIQEHNSLYNLINPGDARPTHTIYLNDFDSFRARWPEKDTKPYKKTVMMLHAQNIELDKFKETRNEAAMSSMDFVLDRLPMDQENMVGEEVESLDIDDDEIDDEELEGGSEIPLDELIDDGHIPMAEDGEYDDDGTGEEEDGEEEMDGSDTASITTYFGDVDEDPMDDYEDYEGEEEEDDNDGIIDENMTREDLIEMFNRQMGQHLNEAMNEEGDGDDAIGEEEVDPELPEGGSQRISQIDENEGEFGDDISEEEIESQYNGSSPGRTIHRRRSSINSDEPGNGESPIVKKTYELHRPELINDALAQVLKQYPFFVRTDIAGLLTATFIDWQMIEFMSVFETMIEEWELLHSKDKFNYKDNVVFYQKLRDAGRKESLVVKNLYPSGSGKPNRRSGHLAGLLYHGEGGGRFDIRNHGGGHTSIFIDRNTGPMNLFDLVRRHLGIREAADGRRSRNRSRANSPHSRSETASGLARQSQGQAPPDRSNRANLATQSLGSILIDAMPVIQHAESEVENDGDMDTEEEADPLGIYKFLEIESPFEFRHYGLKSNFLEKNGIDPLFFSVLDDQDKLDLIKIYLNDEEKSSFSKRMTVKSESQSKGKIREQRAAQAEPTSAIVPEIIRQSHQQSPGFQPNAPEPTITHGPFGDLGDFVRQLEVEFGAQNTGMQIEETPMKSEPASMPESALKDHQHDDDHEPVNQQLYDELADAILNENQRKFDENLQTERIINEIPEDNLQRSPGHRPNEEHINLEGMTGIIEEAPAHRVEPAPAVGGINQDNLDFINSVPPEMREEILMTCPDEFLNGLTPQIIEEARGLRARRPADMFMYGFRPELIDFNEQDLSEGGQLNEDEPEDEADAEADKSSIKSVDKNLQLDVSVFMRINKVREPFIHSLLATLYTKTNLSAINYNLFAVVMANYTNQAKIFDALLFILEQPGLTRFSKKATKFPPRTVSMYPSSITNYSEVYNIVSRKILALLNEVIPDFNTFFLSQTSSVKSKSLVGLTEIKKIRAQANLTMQPNGFCRLVELLQIEKLADDKENIRLILGAIYQVLYTTKKKRKEFDANFNLNSLHVNILCQALCHDSLEDTSLTTISNIISILCGGTNNLGLFIDEMKRTLQALVDSIGAENNRLLTLLREAEKQDMLKSQEFLDVLAFHLSDKKKEKRLVKVFKTIERLFEKYFEAYQDKVNTSMEEDKDEKDKEKEIPDSTLDESAKKEIRAKFSQLLEDQNLFKFWLDLIEIIKFLNDQGIEYIKIVYPHTEYIQPLIESFFITFKILKDDDHISSLSLKRKGSKKDLRRKKSVTIANLVDELEAEVIENEQIKIDELRNKNIGITDLFTVMCERNKTFLNYMMEKDIRLLTGSFSYIIKKMPRAISFDNKRNFFKKYIKKASKKEFPLHITVRRKEVFLDSFNQIMNRNAQDLKGKLQIEFSGEEGTDAGGLTREWFLSLSREIFNPNYALFQTSATGETFQPNPHSSVNPDHIRYFKFIGIVVGKALHDGYLLDAFFTRSFYKHMCGAPIHYTDMEDIDPDYYKNLVWILKNTVEGFDLTFSYETDEFGQVVVRDLKPGGRNIPVTDETKGEYISLVCYAKMATEIKEQVEAFLEGLELLVPREMLSIFEPRELELMISGLPEIDCKINLTLVTDLRNNTDYSNYTKDSEAIKWFWQILEGFNAEQKANFIQFVTGTSKVPLEGFKALKGIGGQIQRFQIHKVFNNKLLPTSHTCLNQLELPEYDSKEKMKKSIEIVLEMGKEGFGFI